MYGIYANIGGILMVNVTIYTIHGSYGHEHPIQTEPGLLNPPISASRATPSKQEITESVNSCEFPGKGCRKRMWCIYTYIYIHIYTHVMYMYRINDILTIYIYIYIYNIISYILWLCGGFHPVMGVPQVVQVIAYDQWQNQCFESLGHPYFRTPPCGYESKRW